MPIFIKFRLTVNLLLLICKKKYPIRVISKVVLYVKENYLIYSYKNRCSTFIDNTLTIRTILLFYNVLLLLLSLLF